MYKLQYEFNKNTPLFRSNFCGNCGDFIEATSYASIKTRGCCWYFPKYTLMDIKNILNSGKKDFILDLLQAKNSKISQYSIVAEGEFSKDKYDNYLKSNENDTSGFDSKLFFRLCPFATSKGCSIDFTLRPHPCNLYLCREMLSMCGDAYKAYSEERKDYYSYINYFSETLKYTLMDEGVDLLDNPLKAIEVIANTDIPLFLPRKLDEIYFNSGTNPSGTNPPDKNPSGTIAG